MKAKTGRKWKKPQQGQPGYLSPEAYRDKRKQDVTDLLTALEEWKTERSEAQLADFLAKWDDYHGNNPHLIEMGSGGYATDVDAHGAWSERGYITIGKGVGIKIIAPQVLMVDDPAKPGQKKEQVTGYHVVYVYDIRHVIDPDLRVQWNEDHQPDANDADGNPWSDGKEYRHWGNEEEIAAWHQKWDK